MCALLFALLSVMLMLTAAKAAEPLTPAKVAADRQAVIESILKTDLPHSVDNQRQSCLFGQEPRRVAERRTAGAYFEPDAADRCIAALMRMGKEKRLTDYFRTMLPAIGGAAEGYATFARTVGAAATSGGGQVSVGGGKAVNVTAQLALDAGFTIAFEERGKLSSGTVDDAKLKIATEACLGGQLEAKTCFSIGYLQGSKAATQS